MYLLPLSGPANTVGMLVLRGASPGNRQAGGLATTQVRARESAFHRSVRLLRLMATGSARGPNVGGVEAGRVATRRAEARPGSIDARLRAALTRAIPPRSRTTAGRSGGPRSQHVVALIQERVERDFARPLALARLADEFEMNASYLSWAFGRGAGTPFKSYLTALRIRRAQALLRDRLTPISEIARRVGYATPHRFRAAFRSRTGLSPSGWRATIRDDTTK
jgi:AraC-like DNA-binding protein